MCLTQYKYANSESYIIIEMFMFLHLLSCSNESRVIFIASCACYFYKHCCHFSLLNCEKETLYMYTLKNSYILFFLQEYKNILKRVPSFSIVWNILILRIFLEYFKNFFCLADLKKYS